MTFAPTALKNSNSGTLTRRDLENATFERWYHSDEEQRRLLEPELRDLLVQHSLAVMFGVLRRSDPALASEAANRVLMALPTYEPQGSLFTTWVHRIILGVMYDQRRQDRRRKEVSMDIPGFDIPGNPSSEVTDIVLTVRKLLQPDDFHLFQLLLVEGYTQTEVAKELDLMPYQVSREWSRIQRILQNGFSKRV